MSFPQRKHLTRLNELFRLPVGEVYLLTANCASRRPVLADDACARVALEALTEYAARHGYSVLLCTVMPDHLHAVVAAREGSSSLSEFVSRWKTWCARKLRALGADGKVWQDEFFDHRIRTETSLGEKCEYVVNNPVRAALVKAPEKWPYMGGVWWEAYLARRKADEGKT